MCSFEEITELLLQFLSQKLLGYKYSMMNCQEIMNSGQNKDETEGVKSVSSSEDVANCKETQIADTEDENAKKSDVNDGDEEKIDKGDNDQLSGAIFTPEKMMVQQKLVRMRKHLPLSLLVILSTLKLLLQKLQIPLTSKGKLRLKI